MHSQIESYWAHFKLKLI